MTCRGTGSALDDPAKHKTSTSMCALFLPPLNFFGKKKKKASRKRKGSDEFKIHYCALHQITFWPIFAPVSADVTEWPTQGKWDPAMHSTQQKHPQEEIFFWAFNIDALKNRRHILKDHFYGKNFSRSFMSIYGTYTLKKSSRFNFGN